MVEGGCHVGGTVPKCSMKPSTACQIEVVGLGMRLTIDLTVLSEPLGSRDDLTIGGGGLVFPREGSEFNDTRVFIDDVEVTTCLSGAYGVSCRDLPQTARTLTLRNDARNLHNVTVALSDIDCEARTGACVE